MQKLLSGRAFVAALIPERAEAAYVTITTLPYKAIN
jgi:hypothetical protein